MKLSITEVEDGVDRVVGWNLLCLFGTNVDNMEMLCFLQGTLSGPILYTAGGTAAVEGIRSMPYSAEGSQRNLCLNR